jgi:hypothetical protein
MERQEPPDPRAPDVYAAPPPYEPPQTLSESSVTQTQGGYTQQASRQVTYQQGMVVQQDVRSVEDQNFKRRALVMRINGVIGFLLGLLETLLALRFILRLANANPTNDFVDFIYGVSSWFIRPFNDIFTDQALDQGSVVEWSTLFAMLIYFLVGMAVMKLVSLIFSPIKSSTQTYTSVQKRRM